MLVHAERAKFWLFSILLALVAFVPGFAAADEREGWHRPFDRIVVFGTSLSDPGNVFAVTGRNLRPQDVRFEDFLVPDYPYANGANHFSNGPTWIEQLARPIGLSSSVRPAYVRSVDGSSNYAVGGARAWHTGEGSLTDQVSIFLGRHDVPADALYVIEMGGNDIRDALAQGLLGASPGPQAILGEAVSSIITNIALLHGAGARKFLVWRAPNVGQAPAIQFFGEAGVSAATVLSASFNGTLDFYLANGIGGLPAVAKLPGIELVRFDAFKATNQIAKHPKHFGLRNATTACINPAAPPYQCQDPDQYFFWDGIHPTRAGHGIIAFLAGKALFKEMELDD
jgi:phospholipase/lecithinase/hemolysin